MKKLESMEVCSMKYLRYTLVFCFLLLPVAALADDQNASCCEWSRVIAAVNQANEDGFAELRLTRGIYQAKSPLPELTGHLQISGNGAEWVGANGGLLIHVLESGYLRIEDLSIKGFTRADTRGRGGLLTIDGRASLERVTIYDNLLPKYAGGPMIVVGDAGFTTLANVTISNNETHASGWAPIIGNFGDLHIRNTTIVNNRPVSERGITAIAVPDVAIDQSVNDSKLTLANTLLDNEGTNCFVQSGTVVDQGGNVATDNSCRLDPGLNRLNVSLTMGPVQGNGGLVPTIGLEPGNPAIDAGNNNNCSATDARFAGRPVAAHLAAEPKCDAGAFEYGGAFGNADLAVNGMNGLWFSQAADGHYIHVLRVSPNRVYLNWTAFDRSADQMWIFAVADTVSESKFSATAYINEGGQLIPGSAPEGSIVNEWGSVELDFSSCTAGTFRYAAHDKDIGSGEFQIDRLAFVEGGGCSD